MSVTIPESHKDLLERPIVITIATLMPDGQPQLAAVWFSYDGEYILVNSATGRQKNKNMAATPKATIMLIDPENPYRYMEVRGSVEKITLEDALEHINQLSEKYRGYSDYYKNMPDLRDTEIRELFYIKPERVVTMG